MSSPLRVFYSWQSDRRGSRNFLDDALERAIRRIDRTDSTRSLELDMATRNVPGAPNIAETILRKIANAAVVVADVTSITDPPLYLPNPNVVLETGSALAKLNDTRVITVVNLAYGRIEDLPFDLRYRRALTYEWTEGTEKGPVRELLVTTLEEAIRLALPAAEVVIGPRPEQLPDPVFRGTQTHWNFPRVQLNPTEKTWLQLIARAFEIGRRDPIHVLIRHHREQLGDKFDPRAFDLRLLKEGGGMITPLGLWQVDPDTPWLTRTDVVFRYLKQLLAHDPRLTVLSVTTIATKLGMTPRAISNVLHLLRATHGWAVAGMSSSPESSNSHPPLVSDFSVNHEQTFKFYETFRTFAEAISATLLAANPPREL